MDDTICAMFEEKNMQILLNTLLFHIENNNNSFELTINLKIPILKKNFIRKLSKFYNEENVEYTISDLNQVLDDMENELKSGVMPILNERAEKLSNGISESNSIDKNLFSQLIENSNTEFKNKLNLVTNNAIFIKLNEVLSQKHLLKGEEAIEKFNLLLATYDNEVEKSICDELNERNRTLLNQVGETFDEYEKLKSKTEGPKLIKKEDN